MSPIPKLVIKPRLGSGDQDDLDPRLRDNIKAGKEMQIAKLEPDSPHFKLIPTGL